MRNFWLLVIVALGNAVLGRSPIVVAQSASASDSTAQQGVVVLDQKYKNRSAEIETAPVEQRLGELDQKLRILERRWELEQENVAARKKETPIVGAEKDGFFLKSADGAFLLKLRGHTQTDGRLFAGDQQRLSTNTLVIRRIRFLFEGTLAKFFDFKFMPDFALGRTVLQDAFLDARFLPQLKLKTGKFKTPFGLERLQSPTNLLFVERALPNNLVPNRDIGVQLHGDLFTGIISYAVGVFNGVADGSSGDFDNSDSKDYAGRLFFSPFKNSEAKSLQGVGAGIAGTYGYEEGTPSAPNLPVYITPGQQPLFRYRSDGTMTGTVIANGEIRRISPQAYYSWGPFGLLGEYVISSQTVSKATISAKLKNNAWQLAASYALTGENASYKGIAPGKNFDPASGNWGSFEIVARISELAVDEEAFPLFANPQASAQKATAWAVGCNWYLNKNVKLVLNYEHTAFKGGAVQDNREDEHALMSRFQIAF